MADIIKIRSIVFIPEVLGIHTKIDSTSEKHYKLAIDRKESLPDAVYAMRSTAEQEVIVDFLKRDISAYCHTSIKKAKITYPNGKVDYLADQKSTDGIRCSAINWDTESVQFKIYASANNLFRPTSASVDYQFHVTCYKDGTVRIKVDIHRLPFYEIYKQVDFQEYEMIYSKDFQNVNDQSETIDQQMKYEFSH